MDRFAANDPLRLDAKGRVSIPIGFVGMGRKFQISEPGRFRAQLAEATGTARAFKKRLGSRVAAHEAQGARE